MERIEGLVQEHRDLTAAFRTNYAVNGPKHLEAEERRFNARLQEGARPESKPDEQELLRAMWSIASHLKPVS